MPTYAFADTMCAISGPNGSFSIGYGSGNAEGGITVGLVEDKNTMIIGADGEVQHNLHSGKGSTATVRLLKTSPTNQLLSDMYARDTASGAAHGRNTIALRDLSRGDTITCREVAFARHPDTVYAKEGGEMVWTFHAGKTDFKLGSGINLAAA